MNVDSSEDVEIYCLKASEVAALTAPATTDFTCKLLQEDGSDERTCLPVWSLDEDEGELEWDEDEGELEWNELVIYND